MSLSIFNVTGLYLWVATIQWDPTALNMTSYSERPFLRQGGQTMFIVGKIGPGKIEGLTCSLHGNVPGVNGKGTLASLQFNATAVGWTSIQITFSDLLDSNGNSMAHYTTNSTVIVFQSSGGGGGKCPTRIRNASVRAVPFSRYCRGIAPNSRNLTCRCNSCTQVYRKSDVYSALALPLVLCHHIKEASGRNALCMHN